MKKNLPETPALDEFDIRILRILRHEARIRATSGSHRSTVAVGGGRSAFTAGGGGSATVP